MAGRQFKFVSLIIAACIVLGIYTFELPTHWKLIARTSLLSGFREKLEKILLPSCPNLEDLTKGRWQPWPESRINSSDFHEVEQFYLRHRQMSKLPATLQRSDNKCGNLPYWKGGFWVQRALCNPKGVTPCCYKNVCQNISKEKCRCKGCYDLRHEVHAEIADWIPQNQQCKVHMYNREEACRLLNGSTVLIAGSSLQRHVYVALVLILHGNKTYYYPPKVNGKTDKLGPCQHGDYLHLGYKCKENLDLMPRVCNNRVKISFAKFSGPEHGPALKRAVLNMKKMPRSLIAVGGLGLLGGDMHSKVLYEQYFKPSLPYLSQGNSSAPQMFFIGTDPPGRLKPLEAVTNRQTYPQTIEFNNKMCVYMKKHRIPCINPNTFLTDVFAFDGVHRAKGANFLKAHILLNFIADHLTKVSNW